MQALSANQAIDSPGLLLYSLRNPLFKGVIDFFSRFDIIIDIITNVNIVAG